MNLTLQLDPVKEVWLNWNQKGIHGLPGFTGMEIDAILV
jgi:hypothetical protein